MMSISARKLAMKLTDAGLTDDEALEWVEEILHVAWDEGASAMHDAVSESIGYNPGGYVENPYKEPEEDE